MIKSEQVEHGGMQVTDMNDVLLGADSFTGDISQGDVSNVTSMSRMLRDATSFTHQLGGAWSTSTADKYCMFLNWNCPGGSIAGKTYDAKGTPE